MCNSRLGFGERYRIAEAIAVVGEAASELFLPYYGHVMPLGSCKFVSAWARVLDARFNLEWAKGTRMVPDGFCLIVDG